MTSGNEKFEIDSPALQRLFASTDVPLALTSAVVKDAPLVMVNDAFLKMTGYDRDEIIGRNCRFLQGPGTDPDARRRLKMAIENHSETLIRIRNYRKDGTPFDNYVFLRPIFSTDGRLIYILGSQYGFTLAESAGDPLEHAELLEAQLEQSQVELRDEQLLMPHITSCSSAVMRALVNGVA